MIFDSEQTGRRHIQPPMSKGAIQLFFKQRGYTEPSFDRQLATTTGQMLNQVVDTKLISTTLPNHMSTTTTSSSSSSVSNRRHPNISNRISEHDNRNLIQNYGEYFGRGFGKRFLPNPSAYNHNWIFTNEPRPVHPDRSITLRDYRGWPPLDNPHTSSINNRKKPSSNWMISCYDDYGRTSEHIPNELLYRNDYKRIPIHPWHY